MTIPKYINDWQTMDLLPFPMEGQTIFFMARAFYSSEQFLLLIPSLAIVPQLYSFLEKTLRENIVIFWGNNYQLSLPYYYLTYIHIIFNRIRTVQVIWYNIEYTALEITL